MFRRVRIYCLSMRLLILSIAAVLLLASCGSEPKPAAKTETPAPVEKPKPFDESKRFPTENLVSTKVVDDHILDKAFMPGGTMAHYKKGKLEYDMFVCRFPNATDSSLVLPDWRKALTDSKLIPSFGGYYGTDNGKPVFVFSKGKWVAGIVGLNEKEFDLPARTLATIVE